MQPFRIICETCHSRLKIRSPDVIGEIHACPKCGSMVHVVPPPGWQAGAAQAEPSEVNSDLALAPALSATSSVIIPAGDFAVPIAEATAPEVHAAALALAPVEPVVQTGMHLLLWTVGGTVGAFLIAGLAWAIWPSTNDTANKALPPTAVAKAKQVADESKSAKKVPPAAQAILHANDRHTAKDSAGDTAAENHIVAMAPSSTAANDSKIATADSPSKHVDVAAQTAASPPPSQAKMNKPTLVALPTTVTVAQASPPSSTTTEPPKPTKPFTEASDHSPVLKFDPLDFDPDRLGAAANWVSGAQTSSTSVPDHPASSVAGGDHTAANAIASAERAGDRQKDALAGNQAPAAAADRSIMVHRGQPAVDGALPQKSGQQMAIQLNAFHATDMPISKLVASLSDISGTGITLDPIALELVGASPKSSVTVDEQNATLEKILRDAVAQRRLSVADVGGQIRVVLDKPERLRSTNYDVKDLIKGQDADEIGHLFERFVAPATWKSAGGKGTIQVNGTSLHIDQSDAVSRQVVIFCERLRLARGLVPRSKYPAGLLSVESPYQQLAAKLDERTTFTFLDGSRLTGVFRQWQEMTGLTILVDWATLSEVDLTPSSPIACSVINRTWADSLNGILEPLGLGWWAVDGQTIQITSLSALEKIERIEFYQVPPKVRAQFANAQALIEALEKQTAEHTSNQGAGDHLQMALDEPSGRLIVLGSPAAQRFLSGRLSSTESN
ncbi:MAG TPA: hypothetical protein VFW73_12130 [Lacipirellulaceae bacterium]|nr:hypothetical protein [Lacipirellulaceae bacterium]